MKASEGLYRLRDVKIKPKTVVVQELPKFDLEANLKELEIQKEKANDFFRKSYFFSLSIFFKKILLENFQEAKKLFTEILKNLEEFHKPEFENPTTKPGTLYVQILNNRAFTYFNLSLFDESISDCEVTLRLDPNSLKGLYRRGLCYFEQSKSKNTLQEQEKFLDKSKKDLEKLMSLNKENQAAKEKLEEIVKESVKVKIKIRELQGKKTEKSNVPQEKTQKNESQQNESKKAVNKKENIIDTDFINDVTFNVAKKVMDDLITSKELPSNPNNFEKDCQAFKNELSRLFFYLKKIPIEHITKLFSKKEIPTDILLLIIESIKITGIK